MTWLEGISPRARPGVEGFPVMLTSGAQCGGNWTEPLRVIYDHELVLFRSGSFVMEIEGAEYRCPAGSFIIVPPGRWHASWETAGKPGYRYWCHFDWVPRGEYGATPVMTFHPAKPKSALFRPAPSFVPEEVLHGRIPVPHRVYDLVDRMQVLYGRDASEHDRVVSRALLLEVLLELLDPSSRTKASGGQGAVDIARRTRELLDDSLGEHGRIRIQDLLAERLGYSYAHLCRVFRARYGVPPLKYLNASCVSRAKLLLRDTDLPVSIVALRLGFMDPFYFSQLFRKIAGCTPTRYREKTSRVGGKMCAGRP